MRAKMFILITFAGPLFSCTSNLNSVDATTSSSGGSSGGGAASCSGGATVFTTNMSPRLVLGQADFVSNSANRGGSAAANTLNNPLGISASGGKLYISDGGNNRVLVYNTIPTTSGASADAVVGQASFTATAGATSATGLSGPQGLSVDSTMLAVAEWTNSRVSLWPLSSLTTATTFWGQPNGTSSTANNGGLGAATLQNATSVTKGGTKYFVNDAGNNRVLIYDGSALSTGQSASVVVGQPNFTSNSSGSGTNQVDFSLGTASDGQKLVVVDSYNNRLLVYNSIPTTDGAIADVVWGGYGASSTTLNNPVGAFYDGQKLFVADRSNDRILVFNSLPTTPGTAADAVLGQATFNSGDHNQCACATAAANTLWGPHFLYWDGCRLYVADTQNHRVLIY